MILKQTISMGYSIRCTFELFAALYESIETECFNIIVLVRISIQKPTKAKFHPDMLQL